MQIIQLLMDPGQLVNRSLQWRLLAVPCQVIRCTRVLSSMETVRVLLSTIVLSNSTYTVSLFFAFRTVRKLVYERLEVYLMNVRVQDKYYRVGVSHYPISRPDSRTPTILYRVPLFYLSSRYHILTSTPPNICHVITVVIPSCCRVHKIYSYMLFILKTIL